MDPNNFPNPNSADDDMQMFGGAHWLGHGNYRVETTEYVGPTFDSEAKFDPFFNTDFYGVDQMEPSCGQPSTPKPRKRTLSTP